MDELEPMPDFAQRLLDAERAAPPTFPAATVDRVLGRVEHTVGLAAPAAAAAGLGTIAKLCLVGAGVLAGSAGVLLFRQVNVFVADPIVVVQQVPVEVRVPAAELPSPAAEAAPLPKAAPAPTAARSDPLDAEQRLLDTARAALVQQRPEAALEALGQHARRFAHGQLAEERDALEVQALWKAGRETEARAKGATFRKRFPQSIFIEGIDALEKSP